MAEERFHIAEWYGRPFKDLGDWDRVKLAGHNVGGAAMSKAELARMVALEEQAALGTLAPKQVNRLDALRDKLTRQQAEELPCPFRTDSPHPTCTKPGGVCSIRIYREEAGTIEPIDGKRGRLRALCPWRFHQDGTAFDKIGESILSDPAPLRAGEVGFLESTGNLDSDPGEDVGRIDMILVKSNGPGGSPMEWVAVEVQAVYFSGKKMSIEFDHLKLTQGKLSMAQEKRRPDYRSSGVKRLMPQLLTKVPTLRRWGKKMAVVVDAPFFYSMGKMERVPHLSNADIVWFLVDFKQAAPGEPYRLEVVEEFYTTLESATLGLTGGVPVSQVAFEDRIKAKVQN
ncbi:NotI family restriction endonuclease [Stappia indica]|uniref:Restriction endonuclease NotI n=1 Tax=Stappia indica TaxID=538381 RepID=A0A285TMW1_9HYPH|nr:NotI family restriction endonuclease [Stappia indica]SOC23796.1 Restriction endonuclease NotI [Stappia indica]